MRAGATERLPATLELSLTAAGRRAIAKFGATAQERLAAGLASMPAARRRVLADALESWLSAAELSDVPAATFFDKQTAASTARAPRRMARGTR